MDANIGTDEITEDNTGKVDGDENINKVTESEIIVFSFLLLGADTTCAVLDLTGVGVAITPIFQGFATIAMEKWMESSKESKNAMQTKKILQKLLMNTVPFFPTLLINFWIDAYIHNHPKIAQLASDSQNDSDSAQKISKKVVSMAKKVARKGV